MIPPSIFTQARKFHIEEAPYSEKEVSLKVKTTLENWKESAQKKHTETLDPVQARPFHNSSFISSCILEKLKTHTPSDRIILCYDSSSNIQAVATTNNLPSHINLECLVTNPNNLLSESNKENPRRIKGSSTAIIAYLFRDCLVKRIHEVQVDALSDSTEFYKKFLFKKVKACDGITTPMKIDSSKIREFLGEE